MVLGRGACKEGEGRREGGRERKAGRKGEREEERERGREKGGKMGGGGNMRVPLDQLCRTAIAAFMHVADQI